MPQPELAGTWFSVLPRELVIILWFWPPQPPPLDWYDDTFAELFLCGCLVSFCVTRKAKVIRQCRNYPDCDETNLVCLGSCNSVEWEDGFLCYCRSCWCRLDEDVPCVSAYPER